MKPDRWRVVKELFDAAVELPGAERASYLTAACGADDALRSEVEALVRADREADSEPLAGSSLSAPARRLAAMLGGGRAGDEERAGAAETDERPSDLMASLAQLDESRVAPAELLRPGIDYDPGDEPSLVVDGGKYQIVRRIGEGGMARVYLAFDTELRRYVALKVAKGDDETQRRRFLDEAQVLGQLEHAGIISVHELGRTVDGRPYYTMRYVKGRPLSEVLFGLRRGDRRLAERYPVARLMRLFARVTDAVGYAHARGVVHRDLKPANVMLSELGETFVVDWGLAKVVVKTEIELDLASGLTGSLAIGTPSYMAPEQILRQRVDPRTDVYALGVILYELLTLELPFRGSRPIASSPEAVEELPTPPSDRAPDREIPSELEEICLRALRLRPDERHASARELHLEVRGWLDASVRQGGVSGER